MADTIKRCSEHLKNFTLMDNTCLKTPTLSMQAMGLFAYLMTLPNDWVVYKSELVNHFSNGRDAVYKAFNELIDNGFITFDEVKNDKGQFKSYTYYIHEQPVEECKRSVRKEHKKNITDITVNGKPEPEKPEPEKPEPEKPEPEKPVTGNPYTENPSLLNTNNTKDLLPSTNKQILSCNEVTTIKSKKIQFKKEDYQKAKDAYWSNCGLLFLDGKIKIAKPVLEPYINTILKRAFTNYGVDTVVEAIRESIKHNWLIEKGYPLRFILGPNELPSLINKTYSNEPKSNQKKDSNKQFIRPCGSKMINFLDGVEVANE